MNREIIFRGKTFDNKWIQGYLFKSWNNSYILWGTTNGIPNMTEVQSNTVGQYVGMDCGKHRIFDGDLLSWSDEEHLDGYVISRSEGIYEVKWREEYLRFDLYDNFTNEWWELNDTEFDDIVGNIHDNYSELLEG